MTSVVYESPGRPLVVREREMPGLGPGDVLLRVDLCGVCASDLLAITGVVTDYSPPVVLGHEIAAEVVESRHLGVAVGSRVTVDPMISCGSCVYCRRGEHKYCGELYGIGHDVDGGFADHMVVPKALVDGNGLLEADRAIASESLMFVEPLGCVVAAMGETPLGDSIAILGAGSIGLMFAQVALAKGLDVFVVEPLEHRRHAAERFGVAVTVAPGESGIAEVEDATDGGVDTVVVATDSEAAIAQAFSLVRRGGAINFFGLAPKGRELAVELEQLHYQGQKLLASWAFSKSSLREAQDLILQDKIDVASLLTDRFPLAEANEAIEHAKAHRGIKTAFDPSMARC